jgi:Squalene-hopene cyclase N-terminal domain
METTLKHRTAIGIKARSAIAEDSNQLESAVKRAQIHLLDLQHSDGFWLGELETNSTLCADYLAFMHWSGEVDPDLQNKSIEHYSMVKMRMVPGTRLCRPAPAFQKSSICGTTFIGYTGRYAPWRRTGDVK